MLLRRVAIFAQTEVDLDTLDDAFASDGVTGWDWARSGITIAAAIIAARLISWLLRRLIRRGSDEVIADLVGRLVAYTIVAFGLIYALEGLGVRLGPLLGALGIIGIAVAFALKDILENFVAGLLLQFRRPFTYGDQIVSGDIEGTVETIGSRSVQIRTPDGETVHLPSSQVVTAAIVNHTTRTSRRTTLSIGVAYGTDLAGAQEVFLDATRNASGVLLSPSPEVLLDGFGDSSIDFSVYFWHEPRIADHLRTRSSVTLALDKACREHGIVIPFPQRTLWSGGTSTTS